AEAIQAGYPTLKIFTTNILPSRSGRMIDFGDIWEAFQVLAREGGLGVIHAEDNDIVMHMYAKLIREGRVEFEHLAEVHNQLSEAIQAGYPTLKIFTTDILPSRSGRMIDFGDIWEAFQVLAREGGLGVIHAEDNDIVMHMYAKLIREGRVEFEHLAEVHNQLS